MRIGAATKDQEQRCGTRLRRNSRTSGGGGGKTRFLRLGWLTALFALAALVGGSLFALAPVRADGHPDDIELLLTIKDDLDNVIPPDSEFTVEVALRFTGPHNLERRLSLADASLRISGALDWETADAHGSRLAINDQFVIGAWEPLTLPGAPPDMNMTARAFDRRTLVGRADDDRLHLFDAWNRRYVTAISPPDDASAGDFGASLSSEGPGIAVWQEDDLTAWLFVGSSGDRVGGASLIGRLYIYKIDWSQTPVAVRLERTLTPDSAEFSNVPVTDSNQDSYYGSAVVISNDGGTLAVSAYDMNDMGAVYLYERPAGERRDWSDISYSDGIRVTAAAVPPWGAANMAPFNYTSMGRTGANSDCDAYCSRVTTLRKSRFGFWGLALSADGRVLAVGAPFKDQDSATPGGSLTLQGTHNTGEVFVFVAPDDGWGSVQGMSETDKELIAAGEDASDFDPAQHYSPGPDRRVTEHTATLIARAWASSERDALLGYRLALSRDGSTVAASYRGRNDDGVAAVQIFQRDSAADWAGAGTLTPSATLSGFKDPGLQGGIAFSPDGSQLLVGDGGWDRPGTSDDAGRVSFFERPANGRWAGASVGSARFRTGRNLRIWDIFAWVLYDLSGERLALSDEAADGPSRSEVGHIWLSDAGCLPTTVDGVTTSICTIELGETRVVVPPGFRPGTHTVSLSGSLRLDGITGKDIPMYGAIELDIGRNVREVAEVSLEFATDTRGTTSTADDRPHPSAIAEGQTTRLELTILNENGVRSSPLGIDSLFITTTSGSLQADLAGGCQSGGVSCQITGSQLVGPNLGRVGLTLTHTGQPGAAVVEGTVLTPTGGFFLTERRTVTFTGPADSLAIAPAATALLNVGTPDDGADKDDRDTLTLAVTATDAAGNTVAPPAAGAQRVTLTDPDGERVTSGVALEWPLGGAEAPTLNVAGQRQVRVNVDRAAAQPLANGEYTLTVRAGTLTATQTLNVSGGPAAITLSEPDGSLEQGGRFSLTATVVDAAGAAVPNGTAVEWGSQGLGTTPGPVRLAAETQTTDGQASAEFLSILGGAVYVTAESGGVTQLRLLRIGDPAAPRGLLDDLSSTAPNSYATWQGEAAVAASALYQALPPTVVRLWRASETGWKHYAGATADDFMIAPGAVLWLSGR